MIRRVIEYIIICDSERVGLGECYHGATAFNAAHYEECEQYARRDKWKQISKRMWLCPNHAEKFEIAELRGKLG